MEPDHDSDHAHFTHAEKGELMAIEHRRRDKRIDKRLLVTYLVTLVIFALLAWRSQVANDRIDSNTRRLAVATWSNCQNLNTRAVEVNDAYQKLAVELRKAPSGPSEMAEAAIYANLVLRIADCGPTP